VKVTTSIGPRSLLSTVGPLSTDRVASPTALDWLDAVRRALKGNGTTAWVQVRDDLLERIERGDLRPGDALPKESLLAEAYAVSKPTLRRALADLAHIGLIRTRHGVGNIVALRPARHRIDGDGPAPLDVLVTPGNEHRVVLLCAGGTPPARPGQPGSPTVSFPDFPGPTVQYSYMSYLDEEPWALSTATVPASLAPTRWEGKDPGLIALIEGEHNLKAHRDQQGFTAVPAGTEEAGHLAVPVGTTLLRLWLTNVDDRGRTILHVVHRLRGDRAEYLTRVPHRQGT
jgi:DNA-binding GntR family transcriptional regulator